MKTLLICHKSAQLDRVVLARWLNSFSEVVGLVLVQERASRTFYRIRSELKRSGLVGFFDALAFRIYHKIFLARQDRLWRNRELEAKCRVYQDIASNVPILETSDPNSQRTEIFIRKVNPDIVVARCKMLLKEKIFSIPSRGTFVMHPGICPEYRNAHGCFWALTRGDMDKVGMTLLKIDRGVDTGPIFGYYTYKFDEVHETHGVIQHRVVLENLDALQHKFVEIFEGTAVPFCSAGRPSAVWGHPRLSKYLNWKMRAKGVSR